MNHVHENYLIPWVVQTGYILIFKVNHVNLMCQLKKML